MFHHKDYQSFDHGEESKEVNDIEIEADAEAPFHPAGGRLSALGGAVLLQVVSALAVFSIIAYTRAGLGKANNAAVQGVQFEESEKLNNMAPSKSAFAEGLQYSLLSDNEKMAMFREFQLKYLKSYAEDEDESARRFQNFMGNLERIDALNKEPSSANYGITLFADYSEEELKMIKGYKMEEEIAAFGASSLGATNQQDAAAVETDTYTDDLLGFQDYSDDLCGAETRYPEFCSMTTNTLPESFDWRDYGAVSSMRNQYICGDCWAFAVTDTIASQWYLAGNALESVSAQEMTSCNQYCWGCDGGWFVGAFTKAMQKTWLSDDTYPFMSMNGVTQACRTDIIESKETPVHIEGWTKVDATDETDMKLALIKNGPMAVAIDATSMEYYTGGIDAGTNCSPRSLDHAVLVVGWGVEDGTEYWIVKNSWGTVWGEDGYWRVKLGKNSCGITEYVMATV